MDYVRGILMLVLGGFVLFRGLLLLPSRNAWVAIALGLVAVALGLWRLLRKPPKPLI